MAVGASDQQSFQLVFQNYQLLEECEFDTNRSAEPDNRLLICMEEERR
jgi:hypothetical protein